MMYWFACAMLWVMYFSGMYLLYKHEVTNKKQFFNGFMSTTALLLSVNAMSLLLF